MLWRQDPRHGRVVIACDWVAASLGVRSGMSLAQASELATHATTPPHVEQHDPQADNMAILHLATKLLEAISPIVAIEALEKSRWAGQTLHQPQSIACDISGIAHLFGGEQGLLDAAQALVTEAGYQARLAIADSFALAWAVAHYGHLLPGHKHSTTFSGITSSGIIIPSGAAFLTLRHLPVESLRIMPDTVATLARLGVYSIDSLLRLPRSGLATRLGDHLVQRIAAALGEIDEPLNVFRPPAEYTAEHELEYPTADRCILENRLAGLVSNVKGGLVASGRGALRLTCCLDLSAHPPLTLEVGLFAPTQDAQHLCQILVTALENKSLPSPVVRLSLAVTLSSSLRSTQGSLFANTSDASATDGWKNHHATARLIDSLSGRLGRESVLGIILGTDPLPEKSYRTVPLTGNSKPLTGNSKRIGDSPLNRRASRGTLLRRVSALAITALTPQKNQRRPIRLLLQPVSIAAEMIFSEDCHAPPIRLCHNGRFYDVRRSWGPERIETGWWYGPCIRRDYYRVETDAGWWWIFRDLTTGDWLLHGQFA